MFKKIKTIDISTAKVTKLKRDDPVFVKSGRDKGKTGKILKIFPKEGRAIVEGVNFRKKHTRRTREDQQGGIIHMESPVRISNIMFYCPRCTRPARLGITRLSDGSTARVCKKCNETVG